MDASLLAAIASFEVLRQPTSLDRTQFANLFMGLFPHVQAETKRTAAAALSRLSILPETIVETIADQPVRIAAPFLAFSSCLGERTLLQSISRHGIDHARAISRRRNLSPAVVTVLTELGDPAVLRSLKVRGLGVAEEPKPAKKTTSSLRERNEETLRNQLKTMAIENRAASTRTAAGTTSVTLGELLVMQAQGPNPVRFSQNLALALNSPQSLAERIILDLSGHQLAMALRSLKIGDNHANSILVAVFPHLAQESDGIAHSVTIWEACDLEESTKRVDAWRRANDDSKLKKPALQPFTTDLPTRAEKTPGARRVRSDPRGRLPKHQARRA